MGTLPLPFYLLLLVFITSSLSQDLGRAFTSSTRTLVSGIPHVYTATASSILKTRNPESSSRQNSRAPYENWDSHHIRRLFQQRRHRNDGEEYACTLTQEARLRIYNASQDLWVIDYEVLEELNQDIQTIINCTSEGDVVLVRTGTTIKPKTTMVIPWNLTLIGQGEGDYIQNESIAESHSKAKFSCPDNATLLVSQSSFLTVANVVFKGCFNTGSIISLDAICKRKQSKGRIRFVHVEFKNNLVSNNQRLLRASKDSCIELELKDVRFLRNKCDAPKCLSMASRNILSDIYMFRNKGTSLLPAHGFFVYPAGSSTRARNISGIRNAIRLFSISKSNFALSDSSFVRNIRNTSSLNLEQYHGGTIILSVSSSIKMVGTTIKSNVASSGGALRARNSKVHIINCTFQGNSNEQGSGAACSFRDKTRVIINQTLFENNVARTHRAGAIFISFDCHINITMSKFENNSAVSDGGAIFARENSTVNISYTNFLANIAGKLGGAISIQEKAYLTIVQSLFLGNRGASGGAVHVAYASSLSIFNSAFKRNKGANGGSIQIFSSSNGTLTNSSFSNHKEVEKGGAVDLVKNSTLSIFNSSFTSNRGHSGGAIHVSGYCILHMKNSACTSNFADNGGAVRIEDSSDTIISRCSFQYNNASLDGGAISVHKHARLNFSRSLCIGNQAIERGGAISIASSSNASILESGFKNNKASYNGGGIAASNNCSLNVFFILCKGNRADSGGGIFLETSLLYAKNSKFVMCHGNAKGGGVAAKFGSSIYCSQCEFKRNSAVSGAGVHITTNSSNAGTSKFKDSVFDSNRASFSGGKIFAWQMFFLLSCNVLGGLELNSEGEEFSTCRISNARCAHLALLETKFINNYAEFAGSAILMTDPNRVHMACARSGTKYQQDSTKLSTLSPKRLCSTWKNNTIANKVSRSTVGTLGQRFILSMDPANAVELSGNTETGYELRNVKSGSQMPVLSVTVVDKFGDGPAATIPNTFEARMVSSNGFFSGLYVANISIGLGKFSSIIGFVPPGNYIIKIYSTDVEIESVNITLHVRACHINEESISNGLLCQECDAFSYNFHPFESTRCTLCPNGANCSDRYIVPEDGRWHTSPCHAGIQKCLIKEACTRENRTKELTDFTTNYEDCNFTKAMLKKYQQKQCREGYTGPLCGSCQSFYGLSFGFQCTPCSSHAFSVVTVVAITLSLFLVSALILRGGIPSKSAREQTTVVRSRLNLAAANSSRYMQLNTQIREIIGPQTRLPVIQEETEPAGPRQQQSQQRSNEKESKKWMTTEVFKIFVSYLQTLAMASSVNIKWTKSILEMFKVSEYVGALATATLTKPVDCMLSSSSVAVRAIWKMLISLGVPAAVIFAFASFWAQRTFQHKPGGPYFKKRLILSIIVVVYVSYLGLTRMAVRSFYCIETFHPESPTLSAMQSYWAEDTQIRCYRGVHYVLMAIGLVILTTISWGFPIVLACALRNVKTQNKEPESMIADTMGFLFRTFEPKLAFWESLNMLRKTFLSTIVVFAYPLGGHVQGLLCTIIVFVFLYAHLIFKPYRMEFYNLNYYEAGSLSISGLTFLLGQFFTVDGCSEFTRFIVALCIVLLNTLYFSVLMHAFLYYGISHLKLVLQAEDIQLPADASWLFVFKAYASNRVSMCWGSHE